MNPLHCLPHAILALLLFSALSCSRNAPDPPAQSAESKSPTEKVAPVELTNGAGSRSKDSPSGNETVTPAALGEAGATGGEGAPGAGEGAPGAGARQELAETALPSGRGPDASPDDHAIAANDHGAAAAPKGWMARVFGGRRSGLATDSEGWIEPGIPVQNTENTALAPQVAGEVFWHEQVPETLKVRFDIDADGFLRSTELRDFQRFLAVKYDANNDGRLSAGEMSSLSAAMKDTADGNE